MNIIEKIKLPVADEMNLFEEKFRQSMKSSIPLLDKITQYIVKRKVSSCAQYLFFCRPSYVVQ